MVTEPIRVLHLINSQQRRGAEVFAAQLATSIQERGRFENLICSLYDRGDDGLPTNGVSVSPLGHKEGLISRVALDIRLLARLWRLLRNFKPAIIVAHGGDTLKYAVSTGMFYRKATTIYRNIGTTSVWARSAARVNLNRLLLNHVDSVVSVSEAVKKDFLEVYRLPEERVTFIPNGVSMPELSRDGRQQVRKRIRLELGLSEQDITFISVGDLSPEKGYQNLLPLLAKLKEEGAENHTLLVGDGPLKQDLQQQSERLGLTDRVHFLGRRNDVPMLLSAADLFVLPSSTEGMPAVLIEAGLSGLPSLAFDVGGVAEVVQHQVTGVLVPEGDFEQLGRALINLASDFQLRSAMGAAARERCHQEFDMSQVASKYEELFLRVLGASQAVGAYRPGASVR